MSTDKQQSNDNRLNDNKDIVYTKTAQILPKNAKPLWHFVTQISVIILISSFYILKY